ncbi:MAG: FAD-dependent oxidoreductase [Nitrososphaeraceae archaeon]|nr:FAD-dependent oxidoreductase [Nitrososphaeraceae archaeon]
MEIDIKKLMDLKFMKLKIKKDRQLSNDNNLIKIDFSLKREVFFVVISAIIGGLTMVLPRTILELFSGEPYYMSWIIYGHVIGVYSSHAALAGFVIHIITAISIGIITGIFLYRTNILNISKPVNGLLYGIFAGSIIFIVWAIPINQFVLMPESARTTAELYPTLSENEILEEMEYNKPDILINSLIINLIFGITVGIVSSFLSIKFGSRYKCTICNVSFSRIDIIKKHLKLVHGREPIEQRKIIILGGGFGGIQVLKQLQKAFQNDIRVDITLLSQDNFFLFTPMLHEVSSGMIETRHVAAPLRAFCKRARFIESRIESIDLDNKRIEFTNSLLDSGLLGIESNLNLSQKYSSSSPPSSEIHQYSDSIKPSFDTSRIDENYFSQSLKYDYLVLALGSNTNFYGNKNIEKASFTMKTLYDAFSIRSHIISTLEQSDILLIEEKQVSITTTARDEEQGEKDNAIFSLTDDHYPDPIHLRHLKKSLTTYVVVGGGFAGVETVGELNDFIKESILDYYQNIDLTDVKVILVNSGSRILPELPEQLADFALEELKKKDVEVLLNNRVLDVQPIGLNNISKKDMLTINGPKRILLKDGKEIIANTIVWTAGVVPERSVVTIPCEHDQRTGKVITDKYLQIKGFTDVYAIGDCALITDPQTGNPYPPTAQHAIRQGKVAAENIILGIKNDFESRKNSKKQKEEKEEKEDNQVNDKQKKKIEYSYQTRGIMATIGKRNGVAMIFGHSIKGVFAWGIWRFFYLSNLPSLENKLRVLIDWGVDMIFGKNITRLKSPIEMKDIISKEADNK